MAIKKYAAKIPKNKNIYIGFVILLSAFMLIIPFYKGLFFRTEYLSAIAFISIVFAAFMAIKLKDKSYKIINTYLDMSVLLIPVAYLISFFFSVNAKDAFDMFLLYSGGFMLYKLVSELSIKNGRYKNAFINVIIASVFLLSFTSMLHLAGIINLNGAFIGNRLFGLYQYANTTASVLGVGIILSLNNLMNADNIKKKIIYQMILTALIPTFIFTLSRGGYLVLVVVLLLNFILVNARAKVKLIVSLVVSFLSSSVFIYKYYTLPQDDLSASWSYYIISIIASAFIFYLIQYLTQLIKVEFLDRIINRSLIFLALAFVGMTIILFTIKEPVEYKIEHLAAEEESWKSMTIILDELKPDSQYTLELDISASSVSVSNYGVVIHSNNKSNESIELINQIGPIGPEIVRKSLEFKTLEDTDRVFISIYNYETDSFTVYKNIVIKDTNGGIVKKIDKPEYIPEAIANRIYDINLSTENVSYRIYFAKDGLEILKDYPLTGAGGGAWRNLYRQYQSIPYNTTEVHNFYVQYGTEAGIIGLVILSGLVILLVMSMIKGIKSGSQYLYVYIAAMLLFLHSMIDFNLSLPAVAYILWMLIGIINSDKNTPLIEKYPYRYTIAVALVFALAVCFSSSSMRYGMKLGAQAAVASQAKVDVNKTIDMYEKAAALDRYNTIYRVDLAQILNKQLRETKDRKYYDEVMEQISFIRKYEPYNHQYTSTICNIYLSIGKFEEASKLVDIKVQDEPLIGQSYRLKVDTNFEIVRYYAQNNTMEEAVPYLKKIVETKVQFEEVNSRLSEPLILDEKSLEKIEVASKALESMMK